MLLHQRYVLGLAIASYVVADERTGEAAVIDPRQDVEDLLRYAKENELFIRHHIARHCRLFSFCREMPSIDRQH